MTSPAKRLRPTAPPSPIALTITPTVPAAGPAAANITPETVPTEWPTITVPAEQAAGFAFPEISTDDMSTEDVQILNAAMSMAKEMFTGADDPIIAAIEQMSNNIIDRLNALTDAVNVVGNQQQWTTDTISQLKGEFEGMLAGGNPLKMISSMLGGKR